jgi:FlaA1/EpsC-like NDP-sugar epimerase
MVASKHILNGLAGWPRRRKQFLMAATDAVILPFSIWAAFALRVGDLRPEGIEELWWLFPSVVLVGLPVLRFVGLYREVTRHAGSRIVGQVAQATAFIALAVATMIYFSRDWAPRSLPVIFFFIGLALLAGVRGVARSLLRGAAAGDRESVVVWGEGMSGRLLVEALLNGQRFRPVALVDEDPSHRGSRVRGVGVHGTDELDALVARHRPKHLLLALETKDRTKRRTILERVTQLPLTVRFAPSMDDVLAGRASADDVREVPIEDLLGREPVPPQGDLLERCVRGRSVLVTGAGGSIGSELCRQALALGPSRLVLYERSEHALYLVHQELALLTRGGVEIVPLLGSVLDRERIERTMRSFAVETVYHAAAFKHVPIVEHNVAEGIENNTIGTLVAAEAALAAGVGTFVLISTDKAVRPTSVMGASKRLAELVLQALAGEARSAVRPTVFSMVRFGNVLGSSGSVVPLFREQIARGGPVTVTHPEMIRYFMTIPEAAQLVMQAGAMAEGGEVFLLDMGEQVRIADLAARMIRLSGRSVSERPGDGGDIAIEYTGLRPGEKLFEELLISADAESTAHRRVRKGREGMMPWADLRPLLEQLESACRLNDVPTLLSLLHRAVPEYRPDGGRDAPGHDLLWEADAGAAAATKSEALP